MDPTKRVSTARVAQIIGVSQPRLQLLIREGRIPNAPPLMQFEGGQSVRLWSPEQIEAARVAVKTRKKRVVKTKKRSRR